MHLNQWTKRQSVSCLLHSLTRVIPDRLICPWTGNTGRWSSTQLLPWKEERLVTQNCCGKPLDNSNICDLWSYGSETWMGGNPPSCGENSIQCLEILSFIALNYICSEYRVDFFQNYSQSRYNSSQRGQNCDFSLPCLKITTSFKIQKKTSKDHIKSKPATTKTPCIYTPFDWTFCKCMGQCGVSALSPSTRGACSPSQDILTFLYYS